MDVLTDLTITVKVDTNAARQEVSDFKKYALEAVEEVRAAYASLEDIAPAFKPARRV